MGTYTLWNTLWNIYVYFYSLAINIDQTQISFPYPNQSGSLPIGPPIGAGEGHSPGLGCPFQSGWGSACDQQCPSDASGQLCGGHGTCDDGAAGSGQCQCVVGYSGAACSLACPTNASGALCGGHGVCIATGTPGVGTCNCSQDVVDGHWAGTTCAVCEAGGCSMPSMPSGCHVRVCMVLVGHAHLGHSCGLQENKKMVFPRSCCLASAPTRAGVQWGGQPPGASPAGWARSAPASAPPPAAPSVGGTAAAAPRPPVPSVPAVSAGLEVRCGGSCAWRLPVEGPPLYGIPLA